MLGLFSISRLRLSSKIGRQYKRESPKNISGKIVLFLSGLNSCTLGAKIQHFAPVLIINAKNALLPHGFFKMVTIFGNFAKGAQWITLFQMARKKAKLLDIYIFFLQSDLSKSDEWNVSATAKSIQFHTKNGRRLHVYHPSNDEYIQNGSSRCISPHPKTSICFVMGRKQWYGVQFKSTEYLACSHASPGFKIPHISI